MIRYRKNIEEKEPNKQYKQHEISAFFKREEFLSLSKPSELRIRTS
jgi:hypothetical protein